MGRGEAGWRCAKTRQQGACLAAYSLRVLRAGGAGRAIRVKTFY